MKKPSTKKTQSTSPPSKAKSGVSTTTGNRDRTPVAAPQDQLAKFLADPLHAAPVHLPDEQAAPSAVIKQQRKLIRSGVLRDGKYESVAILCNDPEWPLYSTMDDGEVTLPRTLFEVACLDTVQGAFLYDRSNPVDSPVNSVNRVSRRVTNSATVEIPLYGARSASRAIIPGFQGSTVCLPVQPASDGVLQVSGFLNRYQGFGSTAGDNLATVTAVFVDVDGSDLPASGTVTNPVTGLTGIPFCANIAVPAAAYGLRTITMAATGSVTFTLDSVAVSYVTGTIDWAPAAYAQLGALRGFDLPSYTVLENANASVRLTANTALFSNTTSVLNAAGTITAAGLPADVPWTHRAVASASSIGGKAVSRQFKATEGMFAALCPDPINDYRAVQGMVKESTNSVIAFFSSPTNDNSFQIQVASAIEVISNDQSFLMTESSPNEALMRPIHMACDQAPLLVWSENPGHIDAIKRFIGRVHRAAAPYWNVLRKTVGLAASTGLGGPAVQGADKALATAESISGLVGALIR